MKNKKMLFTTKWISCTALLTALVVVTGYIPAIPVLSGKIYWCDFAIYTAAYLIDPLGSAIVGGIGTTFFDLFGIHGTAYNAIPSLVIHGLQGCAASLIFSILRSYFNKKGSDGRECVLALISSILPALSVIAGYFIKRLYWEKLGVQAALLKMPANILQEIAGIAVAVIICYTLRLKRQLINARLLPDFKSEILTGKSPPERAEPTEPPESEGQPDGTDNR